MGLPGRHPIPIRRRRRTIPLDQLLLRTVGANGHRSFSRWPQAFVVSPDCLMPNPYSILLPHFPKSALCFSLEERFTSRVWPQGVDTPPPTTICPGGRCASEKFQPSVVSNVGHLAAAFHRSEIHGESAVMFSFALEELTMLLSLFMKPSLPYTVIDQKALFSGTVSGGVADAVVVIAAVVHHVASHSCKRALGAGRRI